MFLKTKSADKKPAGKKDACPSMMGCDMHILGNIVQEGGIIDFEGTLDGNLRCKGITVRPKGIINGEITAETVRVYGRVVGLIKAKNVHLFAGCHIEGIVMHEQLSMEDGAYLDGKCKRTDKPNSAAGPAPVEDEIEEPSIRMLENIRLIR